MSESYFKTINFGISIIFCGLENFSINKVISQLVVKVSFENLEDSKDRSIHKIASLKMNFSSDYIMFPQLLTNTTNKMLESKRNKPFVEEKAHKRTKNNSKNYTWKYL